MWKLTVTWTALAGDTSNFAIELSFAADAESHYYDADERESWGSLVLWINGKNVTEHIEQGEPLRAAHWYLLPTLEWFVSNWDSLFHEERLPLNNAGTDAAGAMTRLLVQPLRLVRPDLNEFQRLEEWQSWWARHNILDSVAGGIFPDLYIRRWGDLAEISVGSTVAPGTPSHFRYQNMDLVGHAPVEFVATSVYDVITRAIDELRRRRPDSQRIQDLSRAADALMDGESQRHSRRLAYLSGANPDSEESLERFRNLWHQVDEILGDDLEPSAREMAVGRPHGGLVLETAPQVALLFGSYSPQISDDDVQVLITSLHAVLCRSGPTDLPNIKLPELPTLPPGPEGSQLGEAAYRELADPTATYVDIEEILERLNITYSIDGLSDSSTRAVSLLSEHHGIHIVINGNYLRGTVERVLRFTLAHELGHILFDRARSRRLAVVSGPWAPQAIEKRANAFAAAFLMPEELIERHSRTLGRRPWRRDTAINLAQHLRVSLSSLADRMYNLLLVTREEADSIVYGGAK